MVLIIAIGDLHFKKDNASKCDLVTSKILEQLRKTAPDFVVLLGDTLDGHEKAHVPTQNRAARFIKHIALICPVVVIIGNHDRPDNTTFLTEESCFYLLKGQDNIHIVDKVLSFKWTTEGSENNPMRFVFVPYVSKGTFHEALDTLEDKVMDDLPTAIFCHQEFKGARIRNHVSKQGDTWPENNPLIISGHIHTFQQVGGNIIYPGTPYQTSYADESKKGILICEFLQGQGPVINFLELDIRKKRTIKLKPTEISTFVPPPNCDIKILIQGSMADIKSAQATGLLKKMKGQGITISLDPITAPNPGNPNNKPYRELLLDNIKDDPEATSMFEEIFADQVPRKIGITATSASLSELLKNVGSIQKTNVVSNANDIMQNILKGSLIRSQPKQVVINRTNQIQSSVNVVPKTAKSATVIMNSPLMSNNSSNTESIPDSENKPEENHNSSSPSDIQSLLNQFSQPSTNTIPIMTQNVQSQTQQPVSLASALSQTGSNHIQQNQKLNSNVFVFGTRIVNKQATNENKIQIIDDEDANPSTLLSGLTLTSIGNEGPIMEDTVSSSSITTASISMVPPKDTTPDLMSALIASASKEKVIKSNPGLLATLLGNSN